jgi:NAD(P)-dependent dehydrogenase (short-subunit alcohol dehydrogenase family)
MMPTPLPRMPIDWAPRADSLRDKVVLIVGAAGGLGSAAVLSAARAGAHVVLIGRKVRPLEKVYDQIASLDAQTPAIYPIDLEGATPRDYAELAETLAREYGRLDGIVLAAAQFDGLRPLADTDAKSWMSTLHVNLSAPFLLVQACAGVLHQSQDASVVFVLDDPARVGKAFWGGYGVAKHGLAGLMSILHEEWENGPVRVHGLQPAPMRTMLRRNAYFGENSMQLPSPEDAANAITYLLSADAKDARGKILDLR